MALKRSDLPGNSQEPRQEAQTPRGSPNPSKMNALVRDIEAWSKERGLHEGDPVKQCAKLFEEGGELTKATIRLSGASTSAAHEAWLSEAKDGIGDCFVVLTIISQRLGLNIQDCVEAAYEEIKSRKGKLVNGAFIREVEGTQTST